MIAFVAHEDIEPTAEWQEEIEIALSTMDAFLVMLTPGFCESKWTDQEVGFAVGRRIPVVPIKLKLNPYGFIGKYQALQGKNLTIPDLASEILDLLLKKPSIGTKITSALVRNLAKCQWHG